MRVCCFRVTMNVMRAWLVLALAVLPVEARASLWGGGPRDQWLVESEVGELPASVIGQLPQNYPPTAYQMNQSTIIMPCNNSGYTDPKSTVGWAIVDFDWSNGKAIWTKQRPMRDEYILQKQVEMSTRASLGQKIWVYRGTVWAYPWYASVRKTLEDSAYADWYIKFKPKGPWYSDKCDKVNTTDCSDLYHNQEQSPGFPTGDGDCGAPNCYCGSNVPCGFYIWNHSSTTVVYGQSFIEWFRDSYVFDDQGMSPLVGGFYFDDVWPASGKFPDPFANMTEDMGLTPEEQRAISKSYHQNMAVIYNTVLQRGKFSWQQMWNGQESSRKTFCCTKPLVFKESCAANLRKYCEPGSPAQTRVLHYAFSPGSCGGGTGKVPLTAPLQDIASFLLIRGPHAYLGHGWLGCSRQYYLPKEMHWDYGKPTGLCQETAIGSGVFERKWTKATITMDCNTWTPTIMRK